MNQNGSLLTTFEARNRGSSKKWLDPNLIILSFKLNLSKSLIRTQSYLFLDKNFFSNFSATVMEVLPTRFCIVSKAIQDCPPSLGNVRWRPPFEIAGTSCSGQGWIRIRYWKSTTWNGHEICSWKTFTDF
jgi:hypothetical protein